MKIRLFGDNLVDAFADFAKKTRKLFLLFWGKFAKDKVGVAGLFTKIRASPESESRKFRGVQLRNGGF